MVILTKYFLQCIVLKQNANHILELVHLSADCLTSLWKQSRRWSGCGQDAHTVIYASPLSPNVADLQHFDTVLFCGFSLGNSFHTSTELFTESLLVVPFSQGLVKKAG